MHDIEPYYNWRHLYTSEEDEQSPFYGRQYNEFAYTNTIYNYFIHPQWDYFGSDNLYIKILYADYQFSFAIIEMIGEWNDCIENDIMTLKREVIDCLISKGIHKFILITENILNFHSSDDCYYEEWWEDIRDEGGWIVALNMPEHSALEFHNAHLDHYVHLMENSGWRTLQPLHLYDHIDNRIIKVLE
ncbi:MAG TPA: hypothetical protein VFX43_08290 [Chitinophagaceae bacterium]|jgi:hypothetical protein|nr:hypothetical protein [Chitinophagaceae bacterium]